MTTSQRRLPLLNLLIAILCIVTVLCQFLPFWENEGATCSLQRMIWFPNDQGSMPNYISDTTGEKFEIDSVVWLTLLTFICSVLGAIFALVKREAFFPSVFSLIGGAGAVINYLTRPALQIGNLWGIHLAAGILMLALGVYGTVLLISHIREEKRA